MNNLPEVVT